ncbi:MAG: metallophosphoesterase [Saprospiraceae bacterium]|jgi:Icc protein
MKIGFITDLHIDNEGILPFDVDVRLRIQRVISYLKNKNYDLIIFGGDLCNIEGNIEIYEWLKKQMDEVDVSYHIIAGNHDDTTLMADVFGIQHLVTENELYYHLSFVNTGDIYFLDTSKGSMSDQQYLWLEDKIINHIHDDIVICMHHPPVLAGSKHMEPKYFFTQSERFKSLCDRNPLKRFIIFSGHYHMARTVFQDNITLFISPATSVQIDPNSEEFLIRDTINFGYREIFYNNHTVNMTNVVYLQ